jgi:hypothetical protein
MLFLNRFANLRIPGEKRLSRPLVILAFTAAIALMLGFLVLGGANMGN